MHDLVLVFRNTQYLQRTCAESDGCDGPPVLAESDDGDVVTEIVKENPAVRQTYC
jgi:hypothetical protein